MLRDGDGRIKGPIRGPSPAGGGNTARSGVFTGLLAALGTISFFFIIALIWGWSVYYGPGPEARQGEATIVTLPSGSGVDAIAARLKAAGVIRSTDLFKAAATFSGADRKLRAGEYQVPDKASLKAVISLLIDGRVVRHFVTIPEGWSSAQAVDILMTEDVLTGTVDTVPTEGSLWPETYEVTRGEARIAVVARMQRAMRENLQTLWATRSPSTIATSPEDAVILASIVEKETGVASERPRVAAVFTNRLRQGIRLESDPTIIYGITQGKPLGRGIRQSELQADTGYNTYLIDGLPPTPIANPGRESIAAVLNPPRTNDLFFVADGSGGHAFAATYAEHRQNVARWREIERRKAGLPPEQGSAVPGTVVPGDPPDPSSDAITTGPNLITPGSGTTPPVTGRIATQPVSPSPSNPQ